MEIKQVEAWTDGSALGNGKEDACCGAGVVLKCNGVLKELSVPLPNYKSNNQAELYAAIAALDALTQSCRVTLFTDSQYVKNGIGSWISGWKRRGWKTAKGEPVKNKELWARLDNLVNKHTVEFVWVKGHADNEMNNRADELAVLASNSVKNGGGL